MDHIIPKHKGGSNDKSNIQLICANCHQDKTEIELRERNLGKKASQEVREKMSATRKGHFVSKETKEKIGRAISLNTERGPKISVAKKGTILSEETKLKISSAVRIAMADPALRKRMSEIKKANPPRYWLGKNLPREMVKK